MKRLFSLCFCCVLFFLGVPLYSQDGIVLADISGQVLDSLTREPLPGAFVSVINRQGSYHFAADAEGKFEIRLANNGDPFVVEITNLGYKISRIVTAAGKEKIRLGKILMVEDPEELDGAVVKGRRTFFEKNGDTLVFFPSSLYLRENASTLDALLKMPGVEGNGAGVTVDGKLVERTYVNGKLVFGKNSPMHALENIEAKDVASIFAYDEYDELSKMQYGEHGRKRKVLNVVTFDFFNQSLVASVTAGGGADLQKDADGACQGRYLAGGAVKFFSEQRQLLADYVGNNALVHNNMLYYGQRTKSAGHTDNQYTQTNKAVIQYADKIKKTWDISGIYKFDDKLSRTRGLEKKEYFATGSEPSRMYADSSAGRRFANSHSGSVKLEHMGAGTYVDMTVGMDFLTDRQVSDNSTSLFTGNLPSSGSSVASNARVVSRNINADGSVFFQTGIGGLSFKGAADLGSSGEDSDRQERYTEDKYDKTVLVTGTGSLRNFRGSAGYSFSSPEAGSFNVGYSAEYKYDKKLHIASDRNTGKVDSTLSRDYTDDYLRNTGKLGYHFRRNDFSFGASLAYENTLFRNQDRFYGTSYPKKSFNAILPRLSLSYKTLEVSYSTQTQAPPLELMSDRLDYRNPMFLVAGNPDLKQGYEHSLLLFFNTYNTERQSSFNANANIVFRNRTVGERTRYLESGEYLPEYRYTAGEGAILTTYENLDGAMSFNCNIGYAWWLKPIQCHASMLVYYRYDKSPMYVDGSLLNRYEHSPSLSFSIESDFSDYVEFSVDYDGSFIYDKAGVADTYSSLLNSLYASVNVEFLKRMYASATYSFYNDYNLTGKSSDVTNHKLDMTVGCRLFKDSRGSIEFTVYDILNRNSGFEQQVFADRIHKVWNYYTPRFAMLTFAYRFQRNK